MKVKDDNDYYHDDHDHDDDDDILYPTHLPSPLLSSPTTPSY